MLLAEYEFACALFGPHAVKQQPVVWWGEAVEAAICLPVSRAWAVGAALMYLLLVPCFPALITLLLLLLLLLRQVWEVQWGRDGYKGTPKVMDLKGHKSQVRLHALLPLIQQQHQMLIQAHM
jgi:hypothetical protein